MDKPTDTGTFSLDEDEDVEDLFASPSNSGATTTKHTPTSQASSGQKYHARSESRNRQQNEQEARDARLRAELERVREVNKVIEGVASSLTKAKGNMETVNRTDLEDLENEDLRRQQEAERRAVEEQRRREEAQRRAEEEERRKAATSASGRGSSRTRGVRGTSSSTRGYTSQTGQRRGTNTSTRGTSGSGIARSGSTRGRGRGLG